MKPRMAWLCGSLLAVIIVAPPVTYYRVLYDHHKRLWPVTAGKIYRAGQMTAEGFRDALTHLKIRTVINVQSEFPDPAMELNSWSRKTISETSVCRDLGVRYMHIKADGLRPDRNNPEAVPAIDDQFLNVLDDPANYPVLLHCRAGLHRTGCLTAVYRMEYEGWSHMLAAAELKGNGFDVAIGRRDCTAANDYVKQYVLNYRKRESEVRNRESESGKRCNRLDIDVPFATHEPPLTMPDSRPE